MLERVCVARARACVCVCVCVHVQKRHKMTVIGERSVKKSTKPHTLKIQASSALLRPLERCFRARATAKPVCIKARVNRRRCGGGCLAQV